jgi:type IV secretory pathway protease TraF
MSRSLLFAVLWAAWLRCGGSSHAEPAHERVVVVYNPTDSVPRGWYRVSSH